MWQSKRVGFRVGKSARYTAETRGPQSYGREGSGDTRLPGKASLLVRSPPVPQTDTGIRVEYTKARELNLSKELGKFAPYLR